MVTLTIENCKECPSISHSGAFTPGGAKLVCDHDDAIEAVHRGGEKPKDYCHWKYRMVRRDRIPEWCPLR